MSQFTVGLSDKPDAWQQFGEFNEAAGTFDFCPDKFIQPLKDRMIFQIQFQEMMAHTVSYFSLHFFLVFLPSFLELSDYFLSKIATVRWLCRRVAVGPREATQSFIRACCSIYSTMD